MKSSRKAADPFLAWVLAAATVVLFALAVWLWLSGRPPGDESAEAGFARDMSTHHAQAVEMAEIVLSPTGSEPAMAWMGMPMDGLMPGMATPEDVNRIREAPPEEADKLFLRFMIPHHRAAVPMAEAVLEETDRPAVEELAGAIATSQKAEIEVMREILKDTGAPPVEDEEPYMDGMDMGATGG